MNWYQNIKTGGYIKPPQEIIDWIYSAIEPYILTAWAKTKIKSLEQSINRLEEQIQSPILSKYLTKKEKIKIDEANRKYIEKNRKEIEDVKKYITVKFGGLGPIIMKFSVPRKVRRSKFPLFVNLKYRASACAHYMYEISSIEIGLYQILYDNGHLIDSIDKLKFYVKQVIGHELIHWMQDASRFLKEYDEWGMPSKKIRNPEIEEKRSRKKDKLERIQEVFETHHLTDTEFFANLYSMISQFRNFLRENPEKTIIDFIDTSPGLHALKKNPKKYNRAIKELYKVYLENEKASKEPAFSF